MLINDDKYNKINHTFVVLNTYMKMRKFDPNASDSGEFDETQNDSPNRDGSGRIKKQEGHTRFAKDKRRRIVRVEKNQDSASSPSKRPQERPAERRSYNPNFTADNKKKENRPHRSPDRDFNKEGRGYSNYNTSKDDYSNSDRYYEGRNERNNNRDNRRGDERRTSEKPYKKTERYGDKDRSSYNRDGNRKQDRPYQNRDRNNNRNENRGYGQDRRDGGGKNRWNGDQKRGRTEKPFMPGDEYPKYPSPKIDTDIRLNRFLAMSGICSRREADDIIASGKVTVNDEVVTELGTKVHGDDIVRYNGKLVRGESKVYIVMNKPKGYVTTLDDPHAEKTVMDLLKDSVKERVYPVGRLDKNSLGVLLITNDGDMTKKLTHPTYAKKKIYQVTLDKALTKADMQQIADGIMLDDGEIHADEINYVNDSRKEIGIEIHSGRNRIIRRIFEHLGYQVQKLDRVYFAGLTKKNLKRGAWRFLTSYEVAALHSGRYE